MTGVDSVYKVMKVEYSHFSYPARYGVYEIDITTNDKVLIQKYKTKIKADSVCKGLNSGKGFAGFTPHFMCIDEVI